MNNYFKKCIKEYTWCIDNLVKNRVGIEQYNN